MKSFSRFLPFLTIFLWASFHSSHAFSQKKFSYFTLSWSFKGIEPGYDHLNKMIVKVDGVPVAESKPTNQSVPGSLDIPVSRGEHAIEVMGWAFYEGKWEEHTTGNNYSINCSYSGTHKIKKRHNLILVFDLDSGTSFTWK